MKKTARYNDQSANTCGSAAKNLAPVAVDGRFAFAQAAYDAAISAGRSAAEAFEAAAAAYASYTA